MAEKWLSSSLLLLLCLDMVALHLADAAVLGLFILGDSTADVGTNNDLPVQFAKANFPHNGIDFPNSRATGRFSNGFNSADYLAKLMGFRRSPPPFLSLVNRTNFKSYISSGKGVNFASGGSGLLDDTGKLLGKVIPLGEQIQQFAMVRNDLTKQLGQEATDRLLSKSVFLISTGSNDIFEYFQATKTAPKQEYITTLISKYQDHLKNLFNLGARKVGLISVPQIGCCPSQRVFNTTGGCMEELNGAAQMFYSTIASMLLNLSSELIGLKYSLGNTFEMMKNFMENPLPFKFTELSTACCGTGRFNGESLCALNATVCLNRDEYLFWDWYHPTEAASELAALTLFGGAQRFVAPINFRQLAEDDS